MSYQISRPDVQFDVDLVRQLNREYETKPLVPKPQGAGRTDYIERGKTGAERLVKRFDIEGKRVLEIGCGTGYISEYLAAHYGCEVYGIDVQPHSEWDEHQHGRFVEFDLSATPLDSPIPVERLGSFDFIHSQSVWEHTLHPYGMLHAAKKLLRPNGTFKLSANLFRGPMASHLYRQLYFPWPHILFSDSVIYDYLRLVSIGEPPRSCSWVNRLSIADYLNYFTLLGFHLSQIIYSVRPLDEEFYSRFEYWLARYPRFDLERDFLHAVLSVGGPTGEDALA